MKSALIVTAAEKSTSAFVEMLSRNACREIVLVKNCGEARRLLISRDFDLYIIHAPLPDEFGDKFAASVAAQGIGQVILVVKAELLEEVSSEVEILGIFTIAEPVAKGIFWNVLKLTDAVDHKMARLLDENQKLHQQIEDLRLIGKAKCILIGRLRISEEEAHKYIEKRAMDLRITKKMVAQAIIRKYEH